MNEKIDIIRRLARKQTSALERALQKTRAQTSQRIVYSALMSNDSSGKQSLRRTCIRGLGIHSRERPRRITFRSDRTVDSTSQSHRSR